MELVHKVALVPIAQRVGMADLLDQDRLLEPEILDLIQVHLEGPPGPTTLEPVVVRIPLDFRFRPHAAGNRQHSMGSRASVYPAR